MSEGANFRNILLIIAGVMLATTLFVVVLVYIARMFDWSISVAERFLGFPSSCEHCGAPLYFKGKNCISCGKPISQPLLKKYKLRMLAVFSFELAGIALILDKIFIASILFALVFVFFGFERHYTKIIRDYKDPMKKA
jgi:hypothetical protein